MPDFNHEDFSRQLRTLIGQGVSDEELNSFGDQVLLNSSQGESAAACADVAVALLTEAHRPLALAHALGTAISICCACSNTADVRRHLEQLVDITREHKTIAAAARAAEIVRNELPGRVGADRVPDVLHQVVRLHLSADAVDRAIETLIVAAGLFADFGAFQTAYRTLVDAERLAREHRLPKELADVLTSLHAVSMTEGDLKFADRVWESLRDAFTGLGQPIPAHLDFNRATSLFWVDELAAAKQAFEEVIARTDISKAMRASVLATLSACLRDLGDLQSAAVRMTQARALMRTMPEIDPEQPLELELIAAKTAVSDKNLSEASACLRRSISWLDAAVGLVEKLHYRRGIRERYIPRIEELLVALPRSGQSADVVPIIAGTRANRLSDWLHFLAWTRQLAKKLSSEECRELNDLVFSLANHGAPHLMGFREKYDDPMGAGMLPDPWRNVAEYADRMCAIHGIDRPFAAASAPESALLIKQRLEEGYALLVNLLTAGKKALLLFGERYILCDLPEAETVAFANALYTQRQNPEKSKDLAISVNAYQGALLKSLGKALDEVTSLACKGLLFFPDRIDLTPISLLTLGHEPIRKRMATGSFSVSTCLALYPATNEHLPPSVALGILEGDSGLAYDRADLEAFFEGSGTRGTTLNKPSWAKFSEQMAHSDVLVLAHHGISVGIFTDPHFADMGGAIQHTAMSLANLQEAAYTWPHRLAVLGTCHSGSLVNRNFQSQFKSHDLIGFPSVFLLNGVAEVVAASWAIVDRFNLMFTTLFAPALREMRPAAAACTALAKLIEMADEDLPALLSRALPVDDVALQASVNQLNLIRRQPYCYGAYQTYTLL